VGRWSHEEVLRVLDEFVGAGDPDDPRERKRVRILESATQLFLQLGYRRTSVDEIARRASVSKGTVYLYFKNKSDLLVHGIAVEKRRYITRLEPILNEDLPPRERLRGWIRLMLELGTEMPLTSRLLGGDQDLHVALHDIDDHNWNQWQEMGVEILGELLLPLVEPAELDPEEMRNRALVLLALRYLAGPVMDDRIRGPMSIHRFAEVLADMLVDGVGAPPTERTEPEEEGPK